MGKDTKKIFGKLISAILLLLIVLPLTISLLLSLPIVQNYITKQAAKIISEKIGTTVSIGYINLGILNDIVMRDLYVEDYGNDTLIYVNRLEANISGLNFLGDKLVINNAHLSDGRLALRQMSDSTLNLKQIIDLIPKKDSTTNNFSLRINSIEGENIHFTFERLEHRNPTYGIDYSNMSIRKINSTLSDFIISGKTVNTSIDQLSGLEQSGFRLDQFSSKLRIDDGRIGLSDIKGSTKESDITMPYVTLTGDSWESYQDFINTVKIEARAVESTLSSHDLAYFAPTFEGKDLLVKQLNFTTSGTVDRLNAEIEYLHIGEDSELSGSFTSRGLPDFDKANFNVVVDNLTSQTEDIDLIAGEMINQHLNAQTKNILNKAQKISLSGTAQGTLNTMRVNALLKSYIGNISYDGSLADLKSAPKIKGALSTNKLNIGNILNSSKLNTLDLKSSIDLTIVNNTATRVLTSGTISSLIYNNYNYSELSFIANYHDGDLQSDISSRDENLNFDLFALASFDESIPNYDLTLRLKNADLAALNINHRDSISRLNLTAKIDARGDNIDNIDGSLTLRDINYRFDADTLTTTSMSLSSVARNNTRYMDLSSEFIDASLSSRYTYKELSSYLGNILRKYLPALYNSPKVHDIHQNTSNDNATLSINFKNFTPLSRIITQDLLVAEESQINAIFNPSNEEFSLRLTSDFVEYKRLAAFSLSTIASNQRDSLAIYTSTNDLYAGGMHLKNCDLMCGALDNKITITSGFRDQEANSSATLGLKASLRSRNRVNIELFPSTISHEGQEWTLDADSVAIDSTQINISNFTIKSGNQTLSLNGIASKELNDSLTLSLRDYDIEMFSPLFSKLGYNISGLTNGYVYLQSALGNTRMRADVKIDEVEVNTLQAPPLQLTAGWDTKRNRAGLNITNRHNQDTLIRGYYIPSEVKYYTQLVTDSIPLALVDPLLKNVVSQTQGHANANITFEGDHLNASLNGHIDIVDMETLVDYTQVRYRAPSARLIINDNNFECRSVPIYDPLDNRGLLTAFLSLDYLSNISYRLRIAPQNMMVLNTTLRDNNIFYGKIFASGVAAIEGDKRGVNMDITATSGDNSQFFMPLTSQSNVMNAEFITFLQPKVEEDPNQQQQRRMNYLRQKQNQGQSVAMNINMALEVSPNTELQLVIDPTVGDIIKARGDGRLNLRISPQDNIFEMYGDYTVSEGNYLFTLQNLINKRFIVEQGSTIQWTGDPMDPLLDIDAIYKLKTPLEPLLNDGSSTRSTAVDCIIHLDERLMQPAVSFGIELPSADIEQQTIIANLLNDQEAISRQFFYLMLANSFISDNASDIGTSTTAATGFELLTNQLSNWLSSSNYNIIIRYRPESETAGTSDEIDVGFSKGLIDNRLLIELEGNYITDVDQTSNLSNFMGEAYITWLIDKAGALQLKGFTQTIDRFDENQGLQETGIGVYYRESFNNIKDLKKQVIDRFKRKKDEENDVSLQNDEVDTNKNNNKNE